MASFNTERPGELRTIFIKIWTLSAEKVAGQRKSDIFHEREGAFQISLTKQRWSNWQHTATLEGIN